ncbi:hypothetical protein ACH5RR_041533 [Cinchona calisaya]|uniref:Uncharacterized protein n=1 Tax=Cinchona calisaya TaxID=153742 RepID=A0ABD2XTW0_9GENT
MCDEGLLDKGLGWPIRGYGVWGRQITEWAAGMGIGLGRNGVSNKSDEQRWGLGCKRWGDGEKKSGKGEGEGRQVVGKVWVRGGGREMWMQASNMVMVVDGEPCTHTLGPCSIKSCGNECCSNWCKKSFTNRNPIGHCEDVPGIALRLCICSKCLKIKLADQSYKKLINRHSSIAVMVADAQPQSNSGDILTISDWMTMSSMGDNTNTTADSPCLDLSNSSNPFEPSQSSSKVDEGKAAIPCLLPKDSKFVVVELVNENGVDVAGIELHRKMATLSAVHGIVLVLFCASASNYYMVMGDAPSTPINPPKRCTDGLGTCSFQCDDKCCTHKCSTFFNEGHPEASCDQIPGIAARLCVCRHDC